MKIRPRSERHQVCLLTVRAHNDLNRAQGKTSFQHGSGGRATRSRNLTEKGLEYMKETLRETRRKISGRLTRKYSTVEDLLFLSKNIIAVKEQMKQFNDLFKMLLDAYQENNQLLGDDEKGRDDNWFDDVDTVWSFKRNVHCWLRKAAQRTKS